MALDQGTTSSRCILFEKNGKIASMVQREFAQIFPHEGWVEHDPMTIWSTQISVATEALLKIGGSWNEVYGIGIPTKEKRRWYGIERPEHRYTMQSCGNVAELQIIAKN